MPTIYSSKIFTHHLEQKQQRNLGTKIYHFMKAYIFPMFVCLQPKNPSENWKTIQLSVRCFQMSMSMSCRSIATTQHKVKIYWILINIQLPLHNIKWKFTGYWLIFKMKEKEYPMILTCNLECVSDPCMTSFSLKHNQFNQNLETVKLHSKTAPQLATLWIWVENSLAWKSWRRGDNLRD